MTPESMVAELEYIQKDNLYCMEVISSKTASKQEKAECRARIIENNHQRMHLETVLQLIKYDPLF